MSDHDLSIHHDVEYSLSPAEAVAKAGKARSALNTIKTRGESEVASLW
jgi:hypothetical protein